MADFFWLTRTKIARLKWRWQSGQVNGLSVIRRVLIDEKAVALTFDDCCGPPLFGDPFLITKMAEILDEYDAKATFFPTGVFLKAYPGLVNRLIEKKCEVGIHGLTHLDLTKLPAAELQREIEEPVKLLRTVVQGTLSFRPPCGHFNLKLEAILKRFHIDKLILWSLDIKDYKCHNSQKIYQRVINFARPGDIILLHGGLKPTCDALEKIVISLKEEGYKLVTVSQLLNLGHPLAY